MIYKEFSEAFDNLRFPPFPSIASKDTAASKAARKIYRQSSATIKDRFRAALEVEYGMVGNLKAQAVWDMAWDDGHAIGYYEVEICYEKYSTLVLSL